MTAMRQSAKRGLQQFLYAELEKLTGPDNDSSVFEMKDSGSLGLKPVVDFHLFVSTSPCGDARVFMTEHCAEDLHPNKMSRGMLRVKQGEIFRFFLALSRKRNSLFRFQSLTIRLRLSLFSFTKMLRPFISRWRGHGFIRHYTYR